MTAACKPVKQVNRTQCHQQQQLTAPREITSNVSVYYDVVACSVVYVATIDR